MEASADVVDLHRVPTRRYDLHELKARLEQEKEASAQPASAGEQIWYVGIQGRKVGPMTRAGLVGLKERGQLSSSSLVWREGWPVWAAAEAVQELRPVLGLSVELALAPPLPGDALDRDHAQHTQPPATEPEAPEPQASAPAPAPLAPAPAPRASARAGAPRASPSFAAVVAPGDGEPPRVALGLVIAAALGLALALAGHAMSAPAVASASGASQVRP
jgi:hypothetical protein